MPILILAVAIFRPVHKICTVDVINDAYSQAKVSLHLEKELLLMMGSLEAPHI